MSLLAEVKGFFSPQAVAVSMEQLPPLETTVVNTLFPTSVEHPFVHIGIGELENVVGTQAVVRRDGQPIPFQGQGDEVNLFAPRPIKPSIDIAASEINDLKAVWGNKITMQQFVSRQVD
ncbi:MAG: major capsid protein, partial [Candidatus Adiutrix sp.]|nr:major capsid protein [Candidatus Adiutrix sp.]